MYEPLVSIIIRSCNERWALQATLPAVQAQEYTRWELIVVDSGSTDGSVELIEQTCPDHFVQIRRHEYVPGRVLNHAMRLAQGELGIFLNADATPVSRAWLGPLVQALADPRTAAVFGRQVPRPDCAAVFAHDYERCFGRHRQSAAWPHFFSLVSSGIRRDVWAQRGFREELQYSEDDEFTRWCCGQGYRIAYCPESVVMHSHNYSPRQAYQRSFGEGWALAAVWPGRRTEFHWLRTVGLGWLRDAQRDLAFCLRSGRLREWPHALRIRWEQRVGKLAGIKAGWPMHRKVAAR